MAPTACTPQPRIGRDRCPGSLALHEAQDGWLARIRVPGGRLESHQVDALARAARLGNGLVEVTSRANVQVRGLPAHVEPELESILRNAELLPSPPHDRARNILASPVAGRHPEARSSTDAIVSRVDRELCSQPALAELPGRFLFAVDDGSGIALHLPADVALVARDDRIYELVIDGHLAAARVPADCAAETAVAAGAAFLDERNRLGMRAWRIAELEHGAAAVARSIGAKLVGPLASQPRPALRPGRLEQRDGRLALSALVPLGRMDGDDLRRLADAAPEVRLGTQRTVTVPDVEPRGIRELERQLGAARLVLARDSGWIGLSACAGLGRCSKARVDVRAAAAKRARTRRSDSPPEHWAACERRCGERHEQPVAVAPMGEEIAVRVGATPHVVRGLDDALEVLA